MPNLEKMENTMITAGTSVALQEIAQTDLAISKSKPYDSHPESKKLLKTPSPVSGSNYQKSGRDTLDGVSMNKPDRLFKDRVIAHQKAFSEQNIQDIAPAIGEDLKDQNPAQSEHDRIKHLLHDLDITYRNENKNLSEMTTTELSKNIYRYDCMYTSIPEDKQEKYGICKFINYFRPETWYLKENFKSKSIPKDSFFLSNVIVKQYEMCFKEKQWLFQLPETIHRCNISNRQSDLLIRQYAGQHDSEKFMHDFLNNTVNGKSTVRIADSFALEIHQLTVKEGNVIRAIPAPSENSDLPNKWLFTVIAHVRPR